MKKNKNVDFFSKYEEFSAGDAHSILRFNFHGLLDLENIMLKSKNYLMDGFDVIFDKPAKEIISDMLLNMKWTKLSRDIVWDLMFDDNAIVPDKDCTFISYYQVNERGNRRCCNCSFSLGNPEGKSFLWFDEVPINVDNPRERELMIIIDKNFYNSRPKLQTFLKKHGMELHNRSKYSNTMYGRDCFIFYSISRKPDDGIPVTRIV